ncbi:delta-lactam-biosynthetic de-N-acetylase [Clostridium sp. YIM B02515]|uniref:Delta-lactam-biosynthetic de-N-acetylase n=1 Tax=Clostridium rhizosphaerae TaxID=2803861 RepID=A0ABS1TFM6_9CLOT|nr:delta-lactam-biosynthetic de-N-acetylase [Clostridium rhizosphaerae]MBL4938110.1 delta-lactam-biosynthetic de-N-acetylase [Clostridium rhizosphaerae]
MNKKIISAILVIPILFGGCTKASNLYIETIKPSVDGTSNNKQPTFEENIVVPQDNEEETSEKKEVKDESNEKFKISKTDGSKISITEKSWFYQPKKDGTPSGEPPEILELIKKYSAYYLGDTSKKVLYLTFDEGYENGYTSKILDTLKANNVKAAFFVTTPYINANKDLIKRMVAEGHLVCNHSNNHPSMAQVALKDKTKFEQEFTVTEEAFEEVTGQKMPKFFRPPMGKYSELSLSYTKDLGYKTIFWSFAYKDWIPTEQPSIEKAKKVIMERTHNGGIVLLHAVSKTNTEIMDSILKEWKSKGFEFKTLNELP